MKKEQEKDTALIEEHCECLDDITDVFQEGTAPKSLSTNPVEDFLSFLEMSTRCLQQLDKLRSKGEMICFFKQKFARHFFDNWNQQIPSEKISFFAGTILFDGNIFNELTDNLSPRIDYNIGERNGTYSEDKLERMERMYRDNPELKSVFDHEPYPFIDIPKHTYCMDLLFADENIYESLWSKIPDEDWANLSAVNCSRITEIQATLKEIQNNHEIAGKWKSCISAYLNVGKESGNNKIDNKNRFFSARETALFFRVIFDELVIDEQWNTKASKEIGEKLFLFSKSTSEEVACESRHSLGGYDTAIGYENAIDKIVNILKLLYSPKRNNNDDCYCRLNNIFTKLADEKANAKKKEIEKAKGKIDKVKEKE